MRGTIIMWNGEKGIVAASGQRYDFDINLWKGDVAPRPDMTVDLMLGEAGLLGLNPIAEADLAKEKLTQISGEGGKMVKGVIDYVGKDVAIAYALFALSALFLSMVSGKGMLGVISIKLTTILNGLETGGDSASGLLMVWLAIGSVAVPYFWKHKYAPLAHCIPLLLTLYADLQLYRTYAAAKAEMAQMGNLFGGQMLKGLAANVGFELGIGVYATFACAAYLAFRGSARFLQRP